MKHALEMWNERERERTELIQSIEEAEADFAAGRGAEYTEETLSALFEELKEEARAMRKTIRR